MVDFMRSMRRAAGKRTAGARASGRWFLGALGVVTVAIVAAVVVPLTALGSAKVACTTGAIKDFHPKSGPPGTRVTVQGGTFVPDGSGFVDVVMGPTESEFSPEGTHIRVSR